MGQETWVDRGKQQHGRGSNDAGGTGQATKGQAMKTGQATMWEGVDVSNNVDGSSNNVGGGRWSANTCTLMECCN